MIYFIQAGKSGPVKIGIDRGGSRVKSLQSSHFEELRVIRMIEGDRQAEAWLHDHFTKRRLRGEWFRFHKLMLTITPPAFAEKSVPIRMMPNEMRDLGSEIWGSWGWQTRLAEKLQVNGATIRKYLAAISPIPGPVAVALRCLHKLKKIGVDD